MNLRDQISHAIISYCGDMTTAGYPDSAAERCTTAIVKLLADAGWRRREDTLEQAAKAIMDYSSDGRGNGMFVLADIIRALKDAP